MSQRNVPQGSNPTISRRSLLAWAALTPLTLPFGCEGPKPLAQNGRVPTRPPPSKISTATTVGDRTSPPAQCVPELLPFGTEVPFNEKDRAFEADSDQFEQKRRRKPGDWLERFSETGLNFDEYVASRPTGRRGQRCVLVLQPLGTFSPAERTQLSELVAFTSVYFDTKVRVAPALVPPKRGQRVRQDGGKHWVQHHTQTILNWLADRHLPADAVCLLGITMDDLYPEPAWNYVFGEATLEKRVGVYSLARYAARFWGEPENPQSRRLQVLRSFKVLAHETGHMFSLSHCRRYECLMNGSNSLEEMDRAPLEPCPVCLKMLQYNLRFDIRSRYRRLMDLYEHNGLHSESDWVKARLERIGCGNV